MDLEEDNYFKSQVLNYTPTLSTENRFFNFPNKFPENTVCKNY
jgi:hypothetical protein